MNVHEPSEIENIGKASQQVLALYSTFELLLF